MRGCDLLVGWQVEDVRYDAEPFAVEVEVHQPLILAVGDEQARGAEAGVERDTVAGLELVVALAARADRLHVFLVGAENMNDARDGAFTGEISAAMLKEAGYAGERIVLLHPTDQTFYDAACHVVLDAFRRVGLNIDDVSTDWGTVVQRRASREPLEKGGWSLFPHGLPAAEYRDPIFASTVRGNGQAGFFGWPTDPVGEALRDQWIDSTDAAEQQRLDREIQAQAFRQVPFIPMGQYFPPAAWRTTLTAPQKGVVPVVWGVSKT